MLQLYTFKLLLATFLLQLPISHWAYDDLADFHSAGYINREYWSQAPYTRIEIVQMLLEIEHKARKRPLSQRLRWSYERLEKEFQREIEALYNPDFDRASFNLGISALERFSKQDTLSYRNTYRLEGWMGLNITPELGVCMRVWIDPKVLEDSTWTGYYWGNNTGGIAESYLQYNPNEKIQIRFGRFQRSWGPAYYGQLLLSNNPFYYNALELQAKLGKYRLTAFHSKLDTYSEINMERNTDIIVPLVNRYLAAHKFVWQAPFNITIGLSESIIYGGPGRTLEFFYLNPVAMFFENQVNENEYVDDNVLYAIDMDFCPIPNLEIYSELLIDDYDLEEKIEPNEIGFTIGMFSIEPLTLYNFSFRSEYTRINNFTYNQPVYWNRYIFHKRTIGHWLGPDADLLSLKADYTLLKSLKLTLQYQQERNGEGNIMEEWTAPWLEDPTYIETHTFLSGIVERKRSLSFNLYYQPIHYVYLSGNYEYREYKNYQNIDNNSLFENEFKFYIGGYWDMITAIEY